jgi:hypothetical protein
MAVAVKFLLNVEILKTVRQMATIFGGNVIVNSEASSAYRAMRSIQILQSYKQGAYGNGNKQIAPLHPTSIDASGKYLCSRPLKTFLGHRITPASNDSFALIIDHDVVLLLSRCARNRWCQIEDREK